MHAKNGMVGRSLASMNIAKSLMKLQNIVVRGDIMKSVRLRN
jgi:hypothetical protein